MKLKSHFIYNRTQRKEILILLVVIVLSLVAYRFVNFSEENIIDTDSPEILAMIREIDSLKEIQKEVRKPVSTSFNPNYITDYKGYTLGMTSQEIDRLLDFRKQGKWINSVHEFQEVTQVSDSLLATFSAQFAFPEWVSSGKIGSPASSKNDEIREKSYAQKIDLNVATVEDLQKVRGIGEVLSERIVNYRIRLGGFMNDSQLYDVYGLEEEVVERVLKRFTVKTPKEIIKMNINTASASDLSTVPGIYYELGKDIWEYRVLRGELDSIEELLKVKGMTESRFKQIQLYLTLE